METIKFLDLKKQYRSIQNEIDRAIKNVIESGLYIGGSFVKDFESAFASFLGVNHCIGVGNGTDALEIAIEALKLPKGSKILVPANSFIGSAEAVTRTGHKIVFVDVDPSTYNMCPIDFEKKISSDTSAVIFVHLYGNPSGMDDIYSLARNYGLKIIEDCAQAHGATINGLNVGTIGDVGCFSFYPGKNLGAYGDGGALVTNNKEIALVAKMISNHGRLTKYDHEFEGRNSRLDALQASILSVKLRHLPKWTSQRVALANNYRELLSDLDEIKLPSCNLKAQHVYHLYVIQIEERNAAIEFLKQKGIECGIHYPTALPKLNAYVHDHIENSDMHACNLSPKLLSLPIGEHLEENDIEYVTKQLKSFLVLRK